MPRSHHARQPAAACRCAATTSTPTASCRRGSCASVSFEGLEQHLFEDDRKADPAASVQRPALRRRVDPRRQRELRLRLVARARAAGPGRAPASAAIVGESFSEIFQGNSAMLGLPCFAADHDDDRAAAGADRADARRRSIDADVDDRASSRRARCASPRRVPPALRDAFLSGQWNPTAMLLDRFDEVRAVAARLPYVSGF